MLSFAITATRADIESPQSMMQQNLMFQCLSRRLKEDIVNPHGVDDACKWRGILCNIDTVQSMLIRLNKHRDSGYHIDMDYLPSSLEFVHLEYIHFREGWAAEHLPRDLKYLYACRCKNRHHIYPGPRVNMNKLPRKLEELHIVNSAFYAPSGVLIINDLPSSIRILNIVNTSLQKVFIDTACMPDGMKVLSIFSYEKVKFTKVGKKSLCRCMTSRRIDAREYSSYFVRFHADSEQIKSMYGW